MCLDRPFTGGKSHRVRHLGLAQKSVRHRRSINPAAPGLGFLYPERYRPSPGVTGFSDGYAPIRSEGAADLTTLDATPGHQGREGVRPVFAPARGEGHLGRAAEFRRDDHERLVEPAARFQVGDQGGERLVERRDQIAAQGLEILAVTIPGIALGALGAKPVDLDQPGTRVQQPAPQQDRLSEKVPAISRATQGPPWRDRRPAGSPPSRSRPGLSPGSVSARAPVAGVHVTNGWAKSPII